MQRAMRWRYRTGWILAGMLALGGTAFAQRVEGDRAVAQGAFAAEVAVRNQTEAERNAGFARALLQVFNKLSGQSKATALPGVGQELRHAKDYVQHYDYRQDEGIGRSGAPSFTTVLVVQFNQQKIENIVSALGIPVWPQPRPKPVIWLAIDDGKGPRLVGLAQNNVVKPLTQRAVERGFRLGLPSGSAAEQAAVGAIWRGDTAAIARLSARYSPPMQLIGKLYRSKAGWTADWIFVDNGRVLSKWSTVETDARRAIAAGADGAADALTTKYAKRSPVGPAGVQRVLFSGLQTSQDFIRLSAYLQGLPVVRKITPIRATANGLEMDLDLLTGLPGFRHMIDQDILVEIEKNDGDTVLAGGVTEFQLR